MVSIALLAATLAFASPAQDGAQSPPTRSATLQLPGVVRFAFGDLRVVALSDGTMAQDAHEAFAETPRVEVDRLLQRNFLRNPVEISINVFLIESGDRLVLVDAGGGELLGSGTGGRLLEGLAAAGFDPARITDVLITHVHPDHLGGLVLGGRPAFPHATIHLGRPDADFYLNPANAEASRLGPFFGAVERCLRPYLDAGRVRTFARTTTVLPGIVAELRPGHTPGTALYTLASKTERIRFIGDIVHFEAVQLPRPELAIRFDLDAKRGVRVREEQFRGLARERTLVASPHLPFPGIGRLRAEARGYSWVPVEYVNRRR